MIPQMTPLIADKRAPAPDLSASGTAAPDGAAFLLVLDPGASGAGATKTPDALAPDPAEADVEADDAPRFDQPPIAGDPSIIAALNLGAAVPAPTSPGATDGDAEVEATAEATAGVPGRSLAPPAVATPFVALSDPPDRAQLGPQTAAEPVPGTPARVSTADQSNRSAGDGPGGEAPTVRHLVRSVESSVLLRAVDAGGVAPRMDGGGLTPVPPPVTEARPAPDAPDIVGQTATPLPANPVLQAVARVSLGQAEVVVPLLTHFVAGRDGYTGPGAVVVTDAEPAQAQTAHLPRAAETSLLLRATEAVLSRDDAQAEPTEPPAPDVPDVASDAGPEAAIRTVHDPSTTTARSLSQEAATGLSFVPDATAFAQPSASALGGMAPTASGAPAFLPAAPHLPATTAPALVLAVAQSGTGTVELVLTPEDLGRLRFEVTQTGDQMRIHLTVDRPETLDLLRRNADQLLSEFRQAGFAGATLSFAQGGQGSPGSQPQTPQPTAATAPPSPAPDHPATAPNLASQPAAGGLDLRL